MSLYPEAATHSYQGEPVESARARLPHGALVRIERRSARDENYLMVRAIDDDGSLGHAFYVPEASLITVEEAARKYKAWKRQGDEITASFAED